MITWQKSSYDLMVWWLWFGAFVFTDGFWSVTDEFLSIIPVAFWSEKL